MPDLKPRPPLPPGTLLGMLGGGQLGRMFIDAAHRLGYRVHVLSPSADDPAARIADRHTPAAYDDAEAAARFAASVAVVTYEFENVPAATAAAAAAHAPVHPGQHVLRVAQDRALEKQALRELGLPIAPFATVDQEADLQAAAETLGRPAVLKTRTGGYDGKGQRVIRPSDDLAYAWLDLGGRPCVLEAMVDFEQEVSVIAARDAAGRTCTYGPLANTHRNHILDVSVLPAGLDPEASARATGLATRVMEGLNVTGVLCVEFFVLGPHDPRCAEADGRLLINELAPRPHNSGHLTIEACPASQFEQQVRCVAGLPLGDPTPRTAAAMANLLGDLWFGEERPDATPPAFERARTPGVHVHLYGKDDPRPGRKMGHLTAVARTPHEALRDAVESRARL